MIDSHNRKDTDDPVLGISAMLISVVLFSVMDATVKWLGGTYSTQQIMFFRTAVAMVPVLILLMHRGGFALLKTEKIGLHVARSLFGVTAMAFAFYAFSIMRLADAISILHTTPLFMTILSVLVLGERVGKRRWTAVTIGFIGMLIVIRPGPGILDSGGAYMLVATLCIALTTTVIRYLSATDDPVCITFYFTLSGIVVSSIVCLHSGWEWPPLNDWLLLASIGLLGGSAQFAMTFSYRYAEIGMVAPLKYLSIAVGGTLGYLLWGEVPDLQSFIGIFLIVSTGIYTLHRETVTARAKISGG
ncbi:MAG: DMT family transporter [Pseudomonadota bacterium]